MEINFFHKSINDFQLEEKNIVQKEKKIIPTDRRHHSHQNHISSIFYTRLPIKKDLDYTNSPGTSQPINDL